MNHFREALRSAAKAREDLNQALIELGQERDGGPMEAQARKLYGKIREAYFQVNEWIEGADLLLIQHTEEEQNRRAAEQKAKTLPDLNTWDGPTSQQEGA